MKNFVIYLMPFLLLSCIQSSYQQKMSYYALSNELVKTDSLSFITNDGTQYSLQPSSISPGEIQGNGAMKKPDRPWENFSGAVALDSIDLVLSRQNSLGQVFAVTSGALLIGYAYKESWRGPDDPSLELSYRPINSSCPFIYSKTDTGYNLEAEAFGTALGKAMETETRSCLPALSFNQRDLQIRISNERMETQYINSVSLELVVHPADAQVVLDNNQAAWLITHPQQALEAIDHSGRNITDLLGCKDDKFWDSDLANTSFNSTLQDYIELQFARPAAGSAAALIVDAINTELITSVYQSVFNFLGDESLPFLHKLETDTTIIALMQQWLKDCGLHVFILNNAQWEPCGLILPEANAVPFQRLVRLDIPESIPPGQPVRIMMRSLPDVWKINSISMDWQAQPALDIKPVNLIKTLGPRIADKGREILHRDQHYAVLLPGESIDLFFEKSKPETDQAVTALVSVRGYLHEWLIQTRSTATFSLLGNILGESRIEALTYLMKDKRLLLPPIYADWKCIRNGENRR